MRKQITLFLCWVIFCMAVFCPIYIQAATPLDPSADASLTLHYQKEDQMFSDLPISIYRVAEAFSDGTFELIEPFSSYPINIHDITMQEQWKNTAVTLSSYIVANQLMPYREATTNDAGTVVFEHLETGLYLVSEVVAENNSGTYVFNQFMVYLPIPQPDGSFDYDVEAKPKCVDYVPKTEYRVTKLWQDAGKQTDRPEEITVDIYKDGELWETQILGASNNWSYVWYVSDEEQSNWAVVERSVPEEYNVTVQKNNGTFSIINTHKSIQEIPDSPQTGDTSNITLYIMLMCISGIMLIILGIYIRRHKEV
ncbi:MAG: Cna B-type domain-containing protein [Ruminococcaceae bacterium]|nr:Cna B-type domain-containing protein [Oscillospiraceae bacterium]